MQNENTGRAFVVALCFELGVRIFRTGSIHRHHDGTCGKRAIFWRFSLRMKRFSAKFGCHETACCEERAMNLDALMDLAKAAAPLSPNRIRQVGAALLPDDSGEVIAACNTFPNGIADLDWRHEGDGRFVWMEHAERNAIFAAAREGRALKGAKLATTFFPCIDCARAIVQSGIADLVTPEPALADPVWGESFLRSRVILEEGGVNFHWQADGAEKPDTA